MNLKRISQVRLDKQTDYALRVLMYLAANGDRLSTVAAIAARYRISQAHVAHVVHLLGRAGFVETVRGRAGGVRIVGHGASIRVGDVVRTMEADLGVVECLRAAGGHCLITRHCTLKAVLGVATAAFLEALDAHTIEDLVAGNGPLVRALA